MTVHKWEFTARFCRRGFGWRSDLPIQRIKEALAEIKLMQRKEPALAAEGAVSLLEKLSPALEQVDSSSGAIGSAVSRAVTSLVPIIAAAPVAPSVRQRWLERLWQALQDDDIPYIESLGARWGELCATPQMAAAWADQFLPLLEHAWSAPPADLRYFKGTSACLASQFAAGRYERLLSLLERAPFKWWHDRQWGVKALVAAGRNTEALEYAEQSRGLNDPGWQIADACEGIMLSMGLVDEAYRCYAMEANQRPTYLATFRAIAKKYQTIPPERIVRDLVVSTPGSEGKGFAAAKDAGLFTLAIELAAASPTDPRTLTRAAKDFAGTQPEFAIAAGFAALRWIMLGHGYDITLLEVRDACSAVLLAAENAQQDAAQVTRQIADLLASTPAGRQLLNTELISALLR